MDDRDVHIQEAQLDLRRMKSKIPRPPLMVTSNDKVREKTLKSVIENSRACSRKPSNVTATSLRNSEATGWNDAFGAKGKAKFVNQKFIYTSNLSK